MENNKAFKFQRVDRAIFDTDAVVRPTVTYWQDAWRRLRKNPLAMFALGLLILFTFLVLFGPALRGHDYITINASDKNLTPNARYWFGTDALGRDLYSRVWIGARASLLVALVCTLIQGVLGCVFGATMAYFGGLVDDILMRIVEIVYSIPNLLITMLIMMVVGNNLGGLLFALSVASWCSTARLMRGQILQLRQSEFVMAAETLGASPYRVMIKHFLPNILSILIINLASSIPTYIFMEANLSFLGLGLETPAISLGVLISEGKVRMDFFPHQLFFPALILCLIVLAFNLLGDGLRDALDPKMRK